MKEIFFLLKYIYKYKYRIAIGFFFLFFYNYVMSKIPGYFNQTIQEIRGQNRYEVIIHYIEIIFLLTGIVFVSMFLMRILIIGASRYIEYDLRKRLFDKLMLVDDSFYQKNQTGDLISRCTNDLNDVRMLLGPGIMYIPNALSRLIFFIPILYQISYKILLVILVMVSIIIFFILYILPKLRPIFSQVQALRASISNGVWESIVGIDAIRSYVREDLMRNRFRKFNEEYMKKNLSVIKIKAFAWPFFLFLIGITQLIVFYIGGSEVMQGKMKIGDMFQFTMMIAQLTYPILSLGWVMTLLQQGMSALERLNKIFHEEDEQVGRQLQSSRKLDYEIKNLKYFYENEKKSSLEIDRLKIEPDQFIGITGNVGSGKSTLIKLISGTLKPSKGEIFIGGIDILNIDIKEYRAKVALCSQEGFLFSKTVSENVGLSQIRDIDGERVVFSLEEAALYDDVMSMKEGLDVIVGERGVKISGGQSQRMSISRALYSNREIIILDDTLSAVDSLIEKTIIDNLKKLKGNKTLILVSNRISTLKLCDEIIVFRDGKIVEKGDHNQLLKNKEYYSNLYQLQQLEGEVK